MLTNIFLTCSTATSRTPNAHGCLPNKTPFLSHGHALPVCPPDLVSTPLQPTAKSALLHCESKQPPRCFSSGSPRVTWEGLCPVPATESVRSAASLPPRSPRARRLPGSKPEPQLSEGCPCSTLGSGMEKKAMMSPMLAFGGICQNGHMVTCRLFSPAVAKASCMAVPHCEDVEKQSLMSPWKCLQGTMQDSQNLSVVPAGHRCQPPESSPSCECLGFPVQIHRPRAQAIGESQE